MRQGSTGSMRDKHRDGRAGWRTEQCHTARLGRRLELEMEMRAVGIMSFAERKGRGGVSCFFSERSGEAGYRDKGFFKAAFGDVQSSG